MNIQTDKILDALGGTSGAAKLFGISSPSVSQWRVHGIPPARLMYIKLLRPDLFGPASVDPITTHQEAA